MRANPSMKGRAPWPPRRSRAEERRLQCALMYDFEVEVSTRTDVGGGGAGAGTRPGAQAALGGKPSGLGGRSMQDPASELLRISIPRTSVHKEMAGVLGRAPARCGLTSVYRFLRFTSLMHVPWLG
jgi:hypothetical protein